MKKLFVAVVFSLFCSAGFAQSSMSGSVTSKGDKAYLNNIELRFTTVDQLKDYNWEELKSLLNKENYKLKNNFKLIISADLSKENKKNLSPDKLTVEVIKEKDTTQLIEEAQKGAAKLIALLEG
ncbi:hypothetical protein ACFSKU_08545 [Pontibacter silvestris]|uniref:Uncharacterized protein n=1 Tax=Pontibacter silvestris TaxID=2305183 RepID=A0ABW4WW20_9BACT|nr:hypothetical protein [Pontibacter silvestris]MCC9137426.1 hypothetical protein [Pontibacter silvestris]